VATTVVVGEFAFEEPPEHAVDTSNVAHNAAPIVSRLLEHLTR